MYIFLIVVHVINMIYLFSGDCFFFFKKRGPPFCQIYWLCKKKNHTLILGASRCVMVCKFDWQIVTSEFESPCATPKQKA